MNFWARMFYTWRKVWKAFKVYGIIAGPGIIVMVADNDAGGITTYAATGAKFGYSLLWFLALLGPIAYFVQEMTVRLGAVTKRGHAEAIFYGFGPFWGWFSLLDLILVDWLTLITEFIGMGAAMAIFGVPHVLTVLLVIIIMGAMVVKGNYWTWEKVALFFCAMNLVYIPCAFIVRPSVSNVLTNVFVPHFPEGREIPRADVFPCNVHGLIHLHTERGCTISAIELQSDSPNRCGGLRPSFRVCARCPPSMRQRGDRWRVRVRRGGPHRF